MTNPFRLASGHILSHVSKTMQGSCRRYHYIKRLYAGFEKHAYSAFGIYNERPARILQPQPTMTQFFYGCQMLRRAEGVWIHVFTGMTKWAGMTMWAGMTNFFLSSSRILARTVLAKNARPSFLKDIEKGDTAGVAFFNDRIFISYP